MKTLTLLSLASLLAAGLASTAAFAGADCAKHPKSEWLSEAEMKKRIEAQGHKIKIFKIDGNCYEIYGWDKDGKKVEIYFDTKDGSVVKHKFI